MKIVVAGPIVALILVLGSCSSADDGEAHDVPDGTLPAATVVEGSSQTDEMTEGAGSDTDLSDRALGLPDIDAALAVEPAPLGTFIVARDGAGLRRVAPDGTMSPLEIPVYATPFGPPRTLLDVNRIDGVSLPKALTNPGEHEGALVLRVIAGGPHDQWLQVQAPSRPHDRYVWVRRNDFDFGYTNKRIEIDLTGPGELSLIDGDEIVLQSAIVHGRDSRPTPTHVTYVERGVRAHGVSPAYGTAILSMASYSEALGTFGGGGVPSNFLHGTNQPRLMGQRVSSGEIRVPDEVLDLIIANITPGTPVLLFRGPDSRAETLARVPTLAETVSFIEGGNATVDAMTGITPQLWRRCGSGGTSDADGPLCPMEFRPGSGDLGAYLVARPGAGVELPDFDGRVIPVYDVPGGELRTLVHQDPIGHEKDRRVVLAHPTQFGNPLVLWPLEATSDEQWYRVQAPVYPPRQSVWVRASDFDVAWTDMRIEIDIAGEGELRLLDGGIEVVTSEIVSGRESRPTPLGATYVDEVIEGSRLSPAYGSYIVAYPIYSEALSTFGGGRLPNQAVHGTNQPELMGQRVSSGTIRVPSELLTFMVELPPGLLGARVVVFDGTGIGRSTAIAQQEDVPWRPAETVNIDDTSLAIGIPQF